MSDKEKFEIILKCIQKYGDDILPPAFRGKNICNNIAVRNKLFKKFSSGRQEKHPKVPSTTTDDAYLDVLLNYYQCKYTRYEIDDIHKKAMASENIVGELLERYIAQELEPHGWVWASGSVLRAVDFIYPNSDGSFFLLQIKNRDNSENSSSKAIRDGTSIQKWFRTYSRRGGTNWENFPTKNPEEKLSEQGFRAFLIKYISKIKNR